MVSTRSSRSSDPPPSAPAAIDPVSKARTITHMNAEHRADLSAILRRHLGLDAGAAADAELLDLDLASLRVRSASGEHTVALDPPMAAWADRRARLAALVGPPQQPVRFVRPAGSDWVSFGGVVLLLVGAALVYARVLAPGSAAWRALDAVWPRGGAAGFVALVRAVGAPVLAIHLVEMAYLDWSRLAPAGVRRGSRVWWLWIGTTALEGMPAFWRWDREVAGKLVKTE